MADILDDKRGPLLGETAPFFETGIGDNEIDFTDLKGNWVILFSHPEDLLPVFKTRTINHILCKRKIKVVALGEGVSSGIISGRNFFKKYMIKHSLTTIDDTNRKILRSYGLDNQSNEYAADVKGVFVTDPKGILRIKLFHSLKTERNFYEILKLVDALQDAEKQRSQQPDLDIVRRRFGTLGSPKTVIE